MISYGEARNLTLEQISSLDVEIVGIAQATGRVVAEDIRALVDSPTCDVSLKDGYAIKSADISSASSENPVRLKLLGVISAGGSWDDEVMNGTAVRILSGAPIPQGAQAVVADEFASDDRQMVTVVLHSEQGRNILPKSTDITVGQRMVQAGKVLRPTIVGLLAAAGHSRIPVIKHPKVAIIATGDEVIAPGTTLSDGKLYASNLVTLAAWCNHFGMATSTLVVKDHEDSIRSKLMECIDHHDAIITSGGAWKGDRDLVVRLLDELGWEKIYHRVRMGPGKAVGFGLYEGKPVFCLPGGPPSNHIAFLQLALPGLQKLSGITYSGLPTILARLEEGVRGQKDWTQFIHGLIEHRESEILFHPLKSASRLQMMAQAEGIISIPEGVDYIPKGSSVRAQSLI